MKLSIKGARIEKGLTQEEMADALNVSRKTICAWETGQTIPRADKIDAICNVLGRTYDEIKWNK